MAACPVGWGLAGSTTRHHNHQGGILCRKVHGTVVDSFVNGINGVNHQDFLMQACPDGYFMRGINIEGIRMICSRVDFQVPKDRNDRPSSYASDGNGRFSA